MKIYIPTYGRSNQQTTYNELPARVRKHTLLVVDPREAHLYKALPHIVAPKTARSIGPVRQWILDQHDEKKDRNLVMLDDDLTFATRRVDDPTKFSPATEQNKEDMFAHIASALKDYAHVGVCTREGGNRHISNMECTRMLRILAYDARTYKAHGIRYDRNIVMEDFDVTLQLLRMGYKNLVLSGWVHNQRGSGAAGGCSTYRTMEVQAQGAKGLAALHPGFVKVVEKTTKTAWGGATRLDVVVQWRRAYESSK